MSAPAGHLIFLLSQKAGTALFPYMRIFLLTLILLSYAAGPLYSERAPERLKNPKLVQSYHKITSKLNCYCGCHSIVSACGHVDEGCFAVQMRRFVETRLLEGMSEDEIMDGLVNGFGERVMQDPQLKRLNQTGRSDLTKGFTEGFGPAIIVEQPGSLVWYAVLGVFAVVFAAAAFRLFMRKSSDHKKNTKDSQNNSSAVSVDEKILNLDR